MLFNSLIFIFGFLPACWLGYRLLLHIGPFEYSLAWLTLCSLFFYAWWNPAYVALIAASMIINFLLGRGLSQWTLLRKPLLVLGISANLLVLAYYKYCNFFIITINNLTNSHWLLPNIILPLAISFFTFTQIAYLVDAYRLQTRKYSFLHYCLFVSFFPHLIAGPIVHHHQLMPQFSKEKLRLNSTDIALGLTLFTLGLFKKLVLADSLSADVALVYDKASSPDFYEAWLATLSYSLQLYFDFSAYSDMAIGLSLLFGIKLPINFNSPYKAVNIIDFWRRWHISLSLFLKDYLYIPLGGNRKGKGRQYLNLWLTMLLGGLWHGAGINFIIWGGLHGFYLLVNHAWQQFRMRLGITGSGSWHGLLKPLCIALTFMAVMVGWVFFRAADFSTAKHILESMFAVHGFDCPKATRHLLEKRGLWLALLLFLVWRAPNSLQIFARYQPALGLVEERASPWQFKFSLKTGLIASALLFAALSRLFLLAPSEFMYFNF